MKLNGDNSHFKSIECGVPQGCVLVSLLFLIYINDIDIVQCKHKNFTTLYADELGTFLTGLWYAFDRTWKQQKFFRVVND